MQIHENAFIGDGDIWAAIVADSVNPWGNRFTTFRLHYPRLIHAEFMTHRMFSRNASSSRAIPVKKILEQVYGNPAMPIHWGANQAGMQAAGECSNLIELHNGKMYEPKEAWRFAARSSSEIAKAFAEAGYHKQVANRLLEPYQFMNVVVSATDFANFFHLRVHDDADPNIHELAYVMRELYNDSTPELLHHGEWHTPYVDHYRTVDGELTYVSDNTVISMEDAKKISASCAAQASYRNLDTSLDKAIQLYDRLVTMTPIHASPFEHVATPFSEDENMARSLARWDMVASGHVDKLDAQQVMYKGNVRGWTQLRKLFVGENVL